METSTNRNIILHPAKITSVLLPPPFAWHGIPIIQVPIKTSTEISGNCGEGKYAGAESPFVLRDEGIESQQVTFQRGKRNYYDGLTGYFSITEV